MIFTSAGECVAVDAEPAWADRLIRRAIGEPAVVDAAGTEPTPGGTVPTALVRVQAATAPFDRTGLRPVTRGAVSDGRRTVLTDACGSGFDLLVAVDGERLSVTARYRPRPAIRAANLLLSARFALLAGQVLVHYPVLWRAGWRGRVPLHAAVAGTPLGTPLLAGPGGVGKSTILIGLLGTGTAAADGAVAAAGVAAAGEVAVTADNLCCADAVRCFGLAEPLRTDAGAAGFGGRTFHGRVERPLPARVPDLAPDRVVVLERGPDTEITTADPDETARALVAGTYAAGELRRYWAFAATLALATGHGPAHPPIAAVARAYAERLPCTRLRVGDGARVSVAELCGVPA
jgi:hypothetical protein